jgi:uncharacterized protein (DUF302 family)
MTYYFARTLDIPFDDAIALATEQLAAEGFGILADIDVKAKMEEKLGVAFRRYRILGACNPPLAHQILEREDKFGLLMPCNVVVQELPDGKVEVSAIDPLALVTPAGRPDLEPIAQQARERLERVLAAL